MAAIIPGKDIVNSILVPDDYNRKDIINDILVRGKEELPPQPAGTQNRPNTLDKPGGVYCLSDDDDGYDDESDIYPDHGYISKTPSSSSSPS